jgi:hypothetical protein
MRWLGFFIIVLASTLTVSAEDWTTADGKTYKNVVVIAQEDDGVRITYDGGAGKIPYYELPLDLQKRFGEDYDSLEAKRKAAEKTLEDATRNADAAAAAAAQKQAQDEATAAQAAAQSGANGQPGSPSSQPSAPKPAPQPIVNTQPVPQPSAGPSTPPSPIALAAQAEAKALYHGSTFSYDEGQDVCYLDSPAVNVMLVVPEATPLAASPAGTLSLRITTDGHTPQTPDQIQATFIPSGIVKASGDTHNVKFLVDGSYVPVTNLITDDSGNVGTNISFFLSPEQAQSIFKAKNVNFSVGSVNYMIDQNGIATFRKYFDDVDHLPPASSSFIRTYHKFLNRLPSIITVISTVCEYIILGSFAILVAASIAAFVMGVTRFIKM